LTTRVACFVRGRLASSRAPPRHCRAAVVSPLGGILTGGTPRRFMWLTAARRSQVYCSLLLLLGERFNSGGDRSGRGTAV